MMQLRQHNPIPLSPLSVAAVLILAFLSVLAIRQTRLIGDGAEYLLYTIALANHGTIYIEAGDIQEGIALGISKELSPNSIGVGKSLGERSTIDSKGFVRTVNGDIVAWHFWSYAIFVAPLFWFLKCIGWPPLWAFTICNLSWAGVALCHWLRWAPIGIESRMTAAFLFIAGGTTYYVWWTHPEVMSAALLLIAINAHLRSRCWAAATAAGLAATQNPPIAILIPLLFLHHVASASSSAGIRGVTDALKFAISPASVLPAALGLLIALLPTAFYLLETGVTNPILAAGAADPSLISIRRVISLFLDLNSGAIISAGALLPLAMIAATLGRNGPRQVQSGIKHTVLLQIILLTASLAMAALASMTVNWNHGQTVVSRYAYWICVPLIVAVAIGLPSNCSTGVRRLLASIFILQAGVTMYFGVFGTLRGDTTSLKLPARLVMLTAPSLYNPVPQTFIERVQRRTGMPDGTSDDIAFAFPSAESPTKLLIPATLAPAYQQDIDDACRDNSKVGPIEGWVYVNMPLFTHCLPLTGSRLRIVEWQKTQ